MAVNIMIQGTMSNAGKSLLAAGLCRVFTQDGYRVAPFKSQNMALNSFITEEGLEIGRAQAVQAEACRKKPSVYMNPILLKPSSDVGSQVIVNGKARGNMAAKDYFRYKKRLIPDIMAAYERLAEENDIIVIEGAGSPAEINLKSDDIVNMGLAEMLDAPVLLVGDIDRGGVFAQLAGTVMLLEEHEKDRIKGLIINKFRGDVEILKPGLSMIEEICGKPVVGVVPYADVDIDDEDSLSERFSRNRKKRTENPYSSSVTGTAGSEDDMADMQQNHEIQAANPATKKISAAHNSTENTEAGGRTAYLNICVIRLPRISNFSDFRVLEAAEGVNLIYADSVYDLESADMIIIPGTKSTISDLEWMKRKGLANAVIRAARAGVPVIGICGGYQILGDTITDSCGAEAVSDENINASGLGLLPVDTVFEEEKMTVQSEGIVTVSEGIFAKLSGISFKGYEIHMGRSCINNEKGVVFSEISAPESGASDKDNPNTAETESAACSGSAYGNHDGCARGNVLGTYIHGIFDNSEFTSAMLRIVAEHRGLIAAAEASADAAGIPELLKFEIPDDDKYKEEQYDKLADVIRASLDMETVYKIIYKKCI